jgi:hypothetical protein
VVQNAHDAEVVALLARRVESHAAVMTAQTAAVTQHVIAVPSAMSDQETTTHVCSALDCRKAFVLVAGSDAGIQQRCVVDDCVTMLGKGGGSCCGACFSHTCRYCKQPVCPAHAEEHEVKCRAISVQRCGWNREESELTNGCCRKVCGERDYYYECSYCSTVTCYGCRGRCGRCDFRYCVRCLDDHDCASDY